MTYKPLLVIGVLLVLTGCTAPMAPSHSEIASDQSNIPQTPATDESRAVFVYQNQYTKQNYTATIALSSSKITAWDVTTANGTQMTVHGEVPSSTRVNAVGIEPANATDMTLTVIIPANSTVRIEMEGLQNPIWYMSALAGTGSDSPTSFGPYILNERLDCGTEFVVVGPGNTSFKCGENLDLPSPSNTITVTSTTNQTATVGKT